MRKLVATLGLTAWLLWAYGYPATRWQILGHYETQDGCLDHWDMLHGQHIHTPEEPWELTCYPVGVDPTRVHPFYKWIMALPDPDEG